MISPELLEITAPALAVGIMIALTHAPLGVEVLRRGIIFIDLAVAQIAGLGLIVASVLLHISSGWVIQLIALACAMLAGVFFRVIEVIAPEQEEAIIGASFVVAASCAILVLSSHPHAGEEIQHLLSGQMLFVTWSDVLAHLPVYVFILALWFITPSIRKGMGFYLLFALAITSSVQLVGVYLVFASLILPALAGLNTKHPHFIGWGCSIISITSGLIISVVSDLPSGPLIVLAYAIVTILICLVRQKKSEDTGNVSSQ